MSSVTREEILQVFRDSGALLDGHFILRSGLRSRQFFQCALALQDMPSVERLGEALAETIDAISMGIDAGSSFVESAMRDVLINPPESESKQELVPSDNPDSL